MDNNTISKATQKLKKILTEKFSDELEIYMFGSSARNDYNKYSDIDILVLYPEDINNDIEEKINNITYDIELECDVVFGILVYSKSFWYSNRAREMPLYQNVQKEGIAI